MNCCVCMRFSGRTEICALCARMVWPQRVSRNVTELPKRAPPAAELRR
jgi:hypothetical protein